MEGCASEVGPDAGVAQLLDELTGALARSIVDKQRHMVSKEHPAAVDQRRDRSKSRR